MKLLLCAIALLPLSAYADMDVLVVTPSKTSQSIHEVAASASSTSVRPTQTVQEAVAKTPGVFMSNESDGRRGISIRGLSSAYTAILIDGQRVNSKELLIRQNDYDYGWIPAIALDRVEVVRGNGASMYGSDAVGGIVNIITKQPEDVATGAIQSTVSNEIGNGRTLYGNSAYIAGKIGDIGLLAYGDKRNTYPSSYKGEQNVERSAYESYGARMSYGTSAVTMMHGSQERKSATLGSQHMTFDRFAFSDSRDVVSGNLATHVAYDSYTYRDATSLGLHTLSADTAYTGDNRYGLMVLGVTATRDDLDNSRDLKTGSTQQTSYALYGQQTFELGDFALTAGARFDSTDYGNRVSPKLYGIYAVSDSLRFKGGVTTAFKSPGLLKTNPDYSIIACRGACVLYGTPGLKAETSVNTEFGFEYSADTWDVAATVFDISLNDMITWKQDAKNPRVGRYYNVNEANTRGVELTGGIGLTDRITARANFTYVDATDKTANKPLLYQPNAMANGSLSYFGSPWTATLAAQYTGNQWTTSKSKYVKLPAYMSYDVIFDYPFAKHAKVSAAVYNVFDKRIYTDELFGYSELGRRFDVTATFGF